MGTYEEHVGTLREHSDNDGNFYEIKILESIRKSLTSTGPRVLMRSPV
jgi:hypothetical protein